MTNIILREIWNDFGFGISVHHLLIQSQGIDSVFSIHKNTSEEIYPFKLQRSRFSAALVHKTKKINEDVKETFLFITDNEFRKKFSRSYHLIKLVTETEIITVGAYSDSKAPLDCGNAYILCTNDFINLLSAGIKIEEADQLNGTGFEAFKCLYDRNEMAKALLRE